jgi:DNA-binding NarL/FixJ family response regulator
LNEQVANLPLPAPRELEAYTTTQDGEELLILSYAIDEPTPPPGLSAAERSVAMAVLRGLSNTEIARERGTSIRTVANQMRSIFSKLGVASRAELTRFAKGLRVRL